MYHNKVHDLIECVKIGIKNGCYGNQIWGAMATEVIICNYSLITRWLYAFQYLLQPGTVILIEKTTPKLVEIQFILNDIISLASH